MFIFQVYSLIFYLPWVIGLFLFFSGRINLLKSGNIYLKIAITSFIIVHILQNSPHLRYMLPLVPIGYLSLINFISVKIKM
jgi:hypothetical protein